MKLKQLKLQNFRGYKDETVIDFDDLVVLVGKNDAGKSSLFDALDIFFENKSVPDTEDKCVHSEDTEIRITCVFSDIPTEVILDTQQPTNLASEHLLNIEENLEIEKVYKCDIEKPRIAGIFARALHPTASRYKDLLSLTNAKLKARARQLNVNLYNVDQRANPLLRSAIWKHSENLDKQEVHISLDAENAKTIWKQLWNYLPYFALFKSDRISTDQDAEAQDPMKVAIREAIRTEEEILGKIAQKVTKKVKKVADQTVEKIKEMSPELASQLEPHISTKPWHTLFSVRLTGDEDIPINKRGSGTRRLVLLNFFRVKAEEQAKESKTGVIYAIEEPETTQHPHNQIMLVKALTDLAEHSDSQVFLSTHSPMLARRFESDGLRFVTTNGLHPIIRYGCEEGTIEDIGKSLGVLPDHSVKAFLGVEGKHDIGFLRAISKMLSISNLKGIPDLSEAENSRELIMVLLGGSNLDQWAFRLAGLSRPEFYLVDSDKGCEDTIREWKERGCTVWITKRKELENCIHPKIIKFCYPNYKGTGRCSEDVPKLFAQAVHEASESNVAWECVKSDAEALKKKVSRAKKRLNSEFVEKMTPDLLKEIDPKDEVIGWLKEMGKVLHS